jgi:hypothetical protein
MEVEDCGGEDDVAAVGIAALEMIAAHVVLSLEITATLTRTGVEHHAGKPAPTREAADKLTVLLRTGRPT